MFVPVEMVFWSDVEGNVMPIKFRVQAEDDKVTVKIVNAVLVEDSKMAGYRTRMYRADVIYNDMQRQMKLMYVVDDCIWKVETSNR